MGKKSKIYIWLCYLLSLSSGMQMSGQQFVLVDMKNEFAISNALMAAITSVQLVTSVVMTLIMSGIMDKVDHRKLVVFGGGVSTLGILLSGFSTGPVMTTASLIIGGIGSNITMAIPFSIFTSLDPDNITKHVNIQQGALSFGAFASPLILAVLMNSLGLNWRWHYRLAALMLLGIVIMFFVVKPEKQINEMPQSEEKPVMHKGKSVIFSATFIFASLGLALYMAMEAGMLNYAKQYFTVGLDDVIGASWCISLIRLSMTITRLWGGKLIKNRVTMGVVTFALSGVSLLLMALFPIPVVALVWCVLFGLFAGPCWPTIFSMGLEIDTTASGKISNLMMLLNSAGMHLGNLVVGAFIDANGIRESFFLSAGFAIPGIIVFLLAVYAFRKAGMVPEGREWLEAQQK
ncbi:MAG: MFS transporter [Christensenellaceae bacterium]|jgi:MFS family permease